MKTGLVSITFRQLEPAEIVNLCIEHNLAAIEWGGDVHVPPGDLKKAKEVRALTESAGLKVAAYGSYYFLAGSASRNIHPFEAVLESAVALGAPLIRVWAGAKGSDKATEEDWQTAIADSRRIGDLAAKQGLKVAYEYHQGTLTDSTQSAVRLMKAVNHTAVASFWQPPNGAELQDCCEGLQQVLNLKKLESVHVFHWWPGFKDRHPLSTGVERWKKYLRLVHRYEQMTGDKERYVCLEFVKDDKPAHLADDAKTLHQVLAEIENEDEVFSEQT